MSLDSFECVIFRAHCVINLNSFFSHALGIIDFSHFYHVAEDLLLVELKFGKETIVLSFPSAASRIDWVEAINRQKVRLTPRPAKERAAEELARQQAKEGTPSSNSLSFFIFSFFSCLLSIKH